MSNKRYRRKPEENRRTPEQVRETLTDINAAFSSGNFTSDHFKQIHDASRDVLRNSVEREATEKREAQADTHGVDAAAEAAQERFRQRVADAPFPEPVKRLTDDEVLEIMDNLFVKLNHISNNSMYAIDAVNPQDADRAYARDVSERAREPERPVRAHPLVALSNLVLRCSRLMIQVDPPVSLHRPWAPVRRSLGEVGPRPRHCWVGARPLSSPTQSARPLQAGFWFSSAAISACRPASGSGAG